MRKQHETNKNGKKDFTRRPEQDAQRNLGRDTSVPAEKGNERVTPEKSSSKRAIDSDAAE